VDIADADVLAILTRAPSSGGKSRLFAALGRAPDRDLLAALLLDTVQNVRLPDVSCIVTVEPDSACREVESLVPPDVQVLPQKGGALGERMRTTMTTLFAAGAHAVALIGSDLPGIPRACIQRTFRTLAADPESLVLGPSTDGGYYLIGARRVPEVFENIDWGTARVLEQTRQAASKAGFRLHLLDALTDIDTPDALMQCANSAVTPRTSAWLERYRYR
jgi:hypothetical protein